MNKDLLAAVAAIDLSSVRAKFLSHKSLWWRIWRWNAANDIERDYREFLYLVAANNGKTIVPWSQDIDDFWHEHILDTRKYAKDCKSLGVESIHHNPHLPKGTTAHSEGVTTTSSLRRETFPDSSRTAGSSSGCSSYMPWLYSACGGSNNCDHQSSHSSHDSTPCDHSSSHSDSGSSHSSCGGHSDSGSSSSCGGSSCGGSSCGGGGSD